ncbi:MAG TPA: TetR/AcrR family transcriptional regulator C-terminal domain-containing protein, partial [Candidatus Limnocylindrales bacterium]
MPRRPASTAQGTPRRLPLSRERVLQAALALADEEGVEAVSMRRLGHALGVEAMSLYKHVADKENILDGIADLVMAEVEVPSADGDWRAAIRRSAISAHEALRRHPWAGVVLESRLNPGPARLRYLDAVVGVLRGAGFDTTTVAHAFMALDSHTYGFTMQELALPFDAASAAGVAEEMAERVFADGYPNLAAMAELAMSGAQLLDFEFGLDLLLDGLERLR